ncbi:acireductone synthase [Streptomyces sp. DSM 42041]|uniref:Enolase-phosphatase E1 n=1 Tax=Streptomyces hazeniae TaxID=3075538 RepID=A0ABU2NZV5_9ACTN|nr:acireductone synthase [Streptomyces sp. DSM 42041]MDT0382146.1 acireductone synthase [Streptomyces sp. DSM 42041]
MSTPTVVLDIEGTVGSATHVHDVLFPYARERLPQWFDEHRGTAPAVALLAEIRDHLDTESVDETRAVAALRAWSDADVKTPPLKKVQGWIWAAGYADGSLTGHVYDEVPEVLHRWKRSGTTLYIYSSGSAAAQKNWFAHTPYGDLTPLLSGYFDLTTAGSKKHPDSYQHIAQSTGTQPARTLFLSDSAEELDAAAEAGWHTAALRRQDDPRPSPVPGHTTVRSLRDLELDQLMKGTARL